MLGNPSATAFAASQVQLRWLRFKKILIYNVRLQALGSQLDTPKEET